MTKTMKCQTTAVAATEEDNCSILKIGITISKRKLCVAVLHSSQELSYDRANYEQAEAVSEFVQ